MDWTAGSVASVGSTRLVGPQKWCRAGWLSALVAESLRGTRLAPALRKINTGTRVVSSKADMIAANCFACLRRSLMYPLR